MPSDYLGNPLSTQPGATLPAIDDFIEGYLAYETRAEGILEAADTAPESCLANTYAGFLWMLLEAPHAARQAAPYLSRAQQAAAQATRREQLNAAILSAWVEDDLEQALRLCEQNADEFPRDLVVAKLQQYFEFNRGNAPAMLRVAMKTLRAAPEIPYVHGMSAFGFEQCHLLAEAETAARKALAMRRKEPWAQHALAHVLLSGGRIDEGAKFLEQAADTWTDLNSFMLTHIWWHLALFYLSQGRSAAALAIYDRYCWGVAKQYSQDQIGAISLLARYELAGIDVGDRWQDLADYLEVRAADVVQPFLSMQYLYGLARAGRPQAAALLRTVREFAGVAPEFSRAAWRQVALPACEGLYAYAQRDYDRAWRELAAAMPRIGEVGGSHAQRDLFEQIWLDAALRSGRLASAQQMLELRRKMDPDGVPLNNTLAALYGRLGLPQLAQQAAQRAQSARARHER